MKFFLMFCFVSVTVLLFLPAEALACACCAEAGTYSISTKKPTSLETDELKKIKFGAAKLFTTAGEPEDIKGISSLAEDYSLNGQMQNALWKFDFRDDKNKSGTLNLAKPIQMVSFMADLHDSQDTGLGVKLYKEWRFKYRVQTGTGIFQKEIAPATEYFLVLQGRGNNCTQAEDFTHWRLEVNGKRAGYALYGELNSKNPAAN